jgi:hypothetical protein
MHRRMSLGTCMLLLLVFLAGSASASPEPLAAPEASGVGSLDLLDWAWEWLTSLVSEEPADSSIPGGQHLNGGDGGGFMDPNGND